MKIHISTQVKARIVRLGSPRVFGDKKELVADSDYIQRFDKVWDSGLRSSVEEAIQVQRIVEPDVVRDRLKKQFKKSPSVERYVIEDKTLYEFTYKVLSVAQISVTSKPDEYEIDQLWTFTYPDATPELFCFPFDKLEDKQLFEETARKYGRDPRQFAKEIVLEKMNEIIQQLRLERDTLSNEIKRLKNERRKSNIAYYTKVIEEFRKRLEQDIPETSGNHNWQNWIYRNNWMFGTQYNQPIDRVRIETDSIPDFVFPTLDGFIDILEIKKPSVKPIRKDKSHSGAFSWSADISQAIGQVITYLHKIELNQLRITQQINRTYARSNDTEFYVIKPRAFILAGRSTGWTPDEKEAFRKLNYSLNGIEVLTYDDLLRRGESLIELYTRDVI